MHNEVIEAVTKRYFGAVMHESVKTHCSLRYIKEVMKALLETYDETREIGHAEDNIQIIRIQLPKPRDTSLRNGS